MLKLQFYKQGAVVYSLDHAETVYVPIPRVGELVTVPELVIGWVQKIDYDYNNPGRTEITVFIGDRK